MDISNQIKIVWLKAYAWVKSRAWLVIGVLALILIGVGGGVFVANKGGGNLKTAFMHLVNISCQSPPASSPDFGAKNFNKLENNLECSPQANLGQVDREKSAIGAMNDQQQKIIDELERQINHQNNLILELQSNYNQILGIVQQHGSTINQISTTLNQVTQTNNPVSAASSSPTSSLVNLNTASASDLETLPGIGPSLASKIIEYRSQKGPFKSIQDLDSVSGIGDSLINKIKDLVRV